MAKLISKQKGKTIIARFNKEDNERGKLIVKKIVIRENKEVLMNNIWWQMNEYTGKNERHETGWKLKGKLKTETLIQDYCNKLSNQGWVREFLVL